MSENAEDNLLNIGRKVRKVSSRLWRALTIRDRTCRFPGCDKLQHLQAHHIEHWAVHDGGFRVNGRAPHGLAFRRPDGSILPVCPVRAPISGPAGDKLKEVNRRVGLEITADTVDSLWDGEAMDYHMAVDGLLDCEEDLKDAQGQ